MNDWENHHRRLLFLCTGNYFRSRFAEELFNHLAVQEGLNWRAVSRGIATELGIDNVGPISPHAVRGLHAREVPIKGEARPPRQLEEAELAEADLVVAVKEAEHHRLLAARFPAWVERVEYWHIDDLDAAPPGEAVAQLERQVQDLVQRLNKE